MTRRVFAMLLIGSMSIFLNSGLTIAQEDYSIDAPAEDPGNVSNQQEMPSTANPVLWKQYQAVQAGTPIRGNHSGACGNGACGNGSCGNNPYNRCGCNTELFPWIDGSGNCDSWCVGPKWQVEASGLMLFREDTNWDPVIAAVGGAVSGIDQFDHGIGGRVFVTGYNESGWGMQVGWEGVDSWEASLGFDPVGTETRTFIYQSRLNSVEVNFLPMVPYKWKLFTGFRYVEMGENFSDARINDKLIPPPVAVPAAPVAVIDTTVSRLLKNQLIGFQFGVRRDNWNCSNKFYLDTFANAGVYCNRFSRVDVVQTDTTIITGDDIDTPENEFLISTSSVRTKTRSNPTDVAFLGEAGISAVWKINHCAALRTGYQIMAIDGVGNALDAYFASGLNGDTVVYHGLQFGFEYRR